MIFSLDVRRARKGDCLLLHFGSKDEPGLVMIDGGPRGLRAVAEAAPGRSGRRAAWPRRRRSPWTC